MKRLLFLFLLIVCAFSLPAQTTKEIEQIRKKRAAVEKQIKDAEKIALSTGKSVRSELNNLNTLSGQIKKSAQDIEEIGEDVKTVDREISMLSDSLAILQSQLEERKKKYASSLQTIYRAKSFHEKLMFVFSASSFQQAYRRARYLQDYAEYQHVLGRAVMQQQSKIRLKQKEMEAVRTVKNNLLREGEARKKELEGQEEEKRVLVSKLQKRQKELTQEINRNKKETDRLNKEIDRLIAIEVEKARKRAAEEAKRRAAAEAAARKKAESASSKSSSKKEETKKPVAPMESYRASNEDVKLSSNFMANRGRLPIPITGSYLIVSRYGEYVVEGTKGARLDNKGINIQGPPGAQARSIFDGEVVSIFQVGGLSNVIVRHGIYLSVYCNLSSVSVSSGQKVSTRQSLGRVYSDPTDGNRTILHFQLRKETTKLNPEQWLGR